MNWVERTAANAAIKCVIAGLEKLRARIRRRPAPKPKEKSTTPPDGGATKHRQGKTSRAKQTHVR